MGTEKYKKQINSVSAKLGGGNRENAEWIWQRGKADRKTQEKLGCQNILYGKYSRTKAKTKAKIHSLFYRSEMSLGIPY